MLRLHFTNATALSRFDGTDVEQCARRQLDLGLLPGMPFLLDDGRPMREVNAWLQHLPVSGSPSPRTWKGYAYDVLSWARFLAERDKGPLEATKRDLAAYYGRRRVEGDLKQLLGPGSWNRLVAALMNFYDWAMSEGLVDAVPFTQRVGHAMARGRLVVVVRNMAKEKNARPHAHITWLEADRLRFFLDVGMNGLLPDGSSDPDFHGRQFPRNRAFGDLVAGTGLRQSEASHVLKVELPAVPTRAQAYVSWDLPATICKGLKGRAVWVSPATLRSVHSYVAMERTFGADAPRFAPERPLQASDLGFDAGRIDGHLRRWKTVSVEHRERMVCEDGTSPLLWLTAAGSPLLIWDNVFREATARCRRFEPDFPRVMPHTLRHPFAVHMLRWLLERAVTAVARKRVETGTDLYAGWWRLHDPLRVLQQLMGHSQVTQTEHYLDAIDATQLYAEAADELDHA
jgi:site-specific recombinase XerD